MMAKYGLNKSICNYKSNEDPIISKLKLDLLKDIDTGIKIDNIKQLQIDYYDNNFDTFFNKKYE